MKRYLYISSILWCLMSVEALGQEIDNIGGVKTDLSNPDLITRPPMDAYALTYTPERPEGAMALTTQAQCVEAKGWWIVEKTHVYADEDRLWAVGCKISGKQEGRWSFVMRESDAADLTSDHIMGYTWYCKGEKCGVEVVFNRPNDFVRQLRTYSANWLDGPWFSWDAMGALREVVTYHQGDLHGKYEIYQSCVPSVIGTYDEGKPSGTWEFYEEGRLVRRTHFDRRASAAELPEDAPETLNAVWTEYFNDEEKRVAEGYAVTNSAWDSGSKIGTIKLYTTAGNAWMEIRYGTDGNLDDPRLNALCKPESQPEHEDPAYIQFDYEDVRISCKDDDEKAYRNVSFYGTGEVWKTETVESENAVDVYEYHPTGEKLSHYRYQNDVPEGEIQYFDREGVPMGKAEYVVSGNGVYRSWWYTGKLREEGEFRNGKRVGTWRLWFETGTQRREEHFSSEGVQDGLVREWYANGVLATEMTLNHGIPSGRAIINYTDGRIGEEAVFKNGQIEGLNIEYAHSGQYKRVTDFSKIPHRGYLYYSTGVKKAEGGTASLMGEEMREGSWDFYLPDGKTVWYRGDYLMNSLTSPKAEACNAIGGTYQVNEDERSVGCLVCQVNRKTPQLMTQMREQEWVWYNEKGNLEKKGTIHMGHLDGEWTYYYPNGNMMLSGQYRLDKKDGKWVAFYEDSSRKFEGYYREGVEDGEWTTFFQGSGKVSSRGTYRSGKRVGSWTWYHANGQIREAGSYEDGLETGEWTTYYDSGVKQGAGKYEKGQRVGIWTWWREKGEAWRTSSFVDGRETPMNSEG